MSEEKISQNEILKGSAEDALWSTQNFLVSRTETGNEEHDKDVSALLANLRALELEPDKIRMLNEGKQLESIMDVGNRRFELNLNAEESFLLEDKPNSLKRLELNINDNNGATDLFVLTVGDKVTLERTRVDNNTQVGGTFERSHEV